MKDLREILGDELWGQVEPKLKGQGINGKDLILVAANTGEYVPADKFDKVKGDADKYKTDFETLNSKYEVDLNTIRENANNLVKTTLVSQALENAKVAKVNGSYDTYINGKVIDLSKLTLENNKITNLETVVSEFVKNNPNLVLANVDTSKAPNQTETSTQQTSNVSIPSANGLNPQTSQNSVKDATYYREKVEKTEDFNEKVALMLEAEQNKINL